MEAPPPGMKRITVRPKCPNPLFEKWLDEWRQEAADKGSEMQYCFGKALKSLRKYPLPLKSGRECLVLECFGDKLCKLLDRKLADYQSNHPEVDISQPNEDYRAQMSAAGPSRKRKTTPKKTPNGTVPEENSLEPPDKLLRQSKVKEYVPSWRSGPYALLLTLLEEEGKPDFKGFMLKAELQRDAQPLCSKSFTRPDPGSHYTAWSSMSILVKKGLVMRFSNPAKFSLTDEGRTLAQKLKDNQDADNDNTTEPVRQMTSNEDIKSSRQKTRVAKTNSVSSAKSVHLKEKSTIPKSSPPQKASKRFNIDVPIQEVCEPLDENSHGSSIVLEKGSFEVLLLVDTCETGGASRKHHNQTVAELTQMKVPFEVRKLEVGDFLWIARSKHHKDDELVLPYIVERKRMDDFACSIKDQRCKEQKFRLKQCGIQNLIYLVESHGSDQHVGLPLSTLQQAAVNTQVIEGFIVKHTSDHQHSMTYLASLTRILIQTFKNKTLLGCLKKDLAHFNVTDDYITLMNFKEFKHCSKKNRNFTVKEMFIRQLVQMKGLSVQKAIAIVEHYPTPQLLVQAYRSGGDETMLSSIPCLGTATKRNVGPTISKAVHFLYCSQELL